MLANTGAELSATETLRARQDQAASLATLVPIHATLTQAAITSDWAVQLPDCGLDPARAQRVGDSPAFGALAGALTEGQRRGYDMTDVLTRVIDTRPLGDADDTAAVLQGRVTTWLEENAVPGPPPRLLAGLIPIAEPPAALADDGELGNSLHQLEELIRARAQGLALEVLHNPPSWARTLGPPPAKPVERSQWLGHVAAVVAYRDQYGIDEQALLGPTDTGDQERQDAWRRAAGAAAAAQRAARPVWVRPRTPPTGRRSLGTDLYH